MLVHTFWPLIVQVPAVSTSPPFGPRFGVARQVDRREVAPAPRLGEALAPQLLAGEQLGHHLGHELRRHVVDHRGAEHLDE